MEVEHNVPLPAVLGRASAKAVEDFVPSFERAKAELAKPILVVGAGGLGCELLKDLALVGFTNIHVIDLDTIDVTNLNRQFLFRPSDVNKSKAEAAAKFVMKRVPSANITWHHGDIMTKPESFYRQFTVIMSGLDSVNARRWLNSMLLELVKFDADGEMDFSTIIPMIDGGTEGFKGGSRIFIPHVTMCFDCALDMFPPQVVFQECTIARTPRQPQHCIAYAKQLQWEAEKPFGVQADGKPVAIDTDNPEHMQWIFEKACVYADLHGIKGVTYKLTQGVVKNIIPAIASTNAITAAACANEAFKYVTHSSLSLDNWIMFNSGLGEYTHTFQFERNPTCPSCSKVPTVLDNVDGTQTVQELIHGILATHPRLSFPSIDSIRGSDGKCIYWPRYAADKTAENLHKQIRELVPSGGSISIVDTKTMVKNSSGATVILNYATVDA